MHHASLNLPELFADLWRGTLECDDSDDISTWSWAVLHGDTWKEHGRLVVNATPYYPGCFGDGPRNIAEKISSGYKASEWQVWFYVLGPALLYGILPLKIWQHYCKLVMGMRMAHERALTVGEVNTMRKIFVSFYKEFETIYYQRKSSRLHFVRQSLHGILHIAEDFLQAGPPMYYAQWTMERTIGNLGEEIRQPSNPYANLSQRSIIRTQLNSLQAACPELLDNAESRNPTFPHGSLVVGGGYVLLRARDHKCSPPIKLIQGPGYQAILRCWDAIRTPSDRAAIPQFARWARLRLPNEQIARSLWKESLKPLEKCRTSRNVKVRVHLSITNFIYFTESILRFNSDQTSVLRRSCSISAYVPRPHYKPLLSSHYIPNLIRNYSSSHLGQSRVANTVDTLR